MYGLKIRFLASCFLDADSITANPRDIAELLRAFEEENLLPITLMEGSPTGMINRIGFHTANQARQIHLTGKRFDVFEHPTTIEGPGLGEFSVFCQEAMRKLNVLLNYFHRRPYRLAAVQEGFLPEMSTAIMDAIARRIMNFPSIYTDHFPFEWDWRSVSMVERQFGGLTEAAVTATTVKRMFGVVLGRTPAEEFDRVRVDLDISTSHQNVAPRFEEEHVRSFFELAPLWHRDLSSEIFRFILGATV